MLSGALFCLSFLAEIGKAQALGRLMIPILSGTGYDQNQDGNQVRQHLKQLLTGKADTGNIAAGHIQCAKDDRTDDCQIRLPHSTPSCP